MSNMEDIAMPDAGEQDFNEDPRLLNDDIVEPIETALGTGVPVSSSLIADATQLDYLSLVNKAMDHGDFAARCIIHEGRDSDDYLDLEQPSIIDANALKTTEDGDGAPENHDGLITEQDSGMAGVKPVQAHRNQYPGSARAPSYDEACSLLHIFPNDRVLPIQGAPRDTQLSVWQFTGLAWMVEQERLGLGGGILADQCGLGKFVTALSLLYSMPLLDDAPRTYKPTLILTPPMVIDTRIDEILDHFGSTVNLIIFRGRECKARTLMNSRIVEDSDALRSILNDLDQHSMGTAHTIVLSSYSTWAAKTLIKMNASITAEDPPRVASSDNDGQEGKKTPRECKCYETMFEGYFHRVILDQGHFVKSISSQRHQAAALLGAPHYWVLSATPILNRVTDLCAYMALFSRPSFENLTTDSATTSSTDLSAEYKTWASREDLLHTPPWHLLKPERLARLPNDSFVTQRCYYAISVICRMICLARKTGDTVDAGEGRTEVLGNGIPPVEIKTIDLRFSERLQKGHDNIYYALVPRLHLGARRPEEETIQQSAGCMNQAIFKTLSHLSFSTDLDGFIRSASDELSGLEGNASRKEALKKNIRSHIKQPDGGFNLFWRHTTADRSGVPPSDPADQAWYLMMHCPKLRYTVKILHDAGILSARPSQDPCDRVIIFCQWPIIVWIVDMLLRSLRVPYTVVVSNTALRNRPAVLQDFRSGTSGAKVLLTTYHYASIGLNMQGGCHKMILMEPPQNLSLVFQCIDGIQRLGQHQRQHVWILFQQHTIERYIWFNNTKKALPTVAATLRDKIEPKLAGGQGDEMDAMEVDLSVGAAEKLIVDFANRHLQRMLGQAESRLNWKNPKNLGVLTAATDGEQAEGDE